jgi:hypothetical protein
MVVRIRLQSGSSSRTLNSGIRGTAIVSAALLTPAAFMAWVLGGWRLMADLKWTADFAIRDGVFSHWQVWVALGIGVQFVAYLLGRVGRKDEEDEADRPMRASFIYGGEAGDRAVGNGNSHGRPRI